MELQTDLIEKGIPYPRLRGRMEKLCLMEIGDSILFKHANPESIRSEVSKKAKIINMTFRTRAYNTGVRVWRVA